APGVANPLTHKRTEYLSSSLRECAGGLLDDFRFLRGRSLQPNDAGNVRDRERLRQIAEAEDEAGRGREIEGFLLGPPSASCLQLRALCRTHRLSNKSLSGC